LFVSVDHQAEISAQKQTEEPCIMNPPSRELRSCPKSTRSFARKLKAYQGQDRTLRLELKNGKPVAMKRGAKNNMFRMIQVPDTSAHVTLPAEWTSILDHDHYSLETWL
jgi:hypothetical protein